MRRKKDDRWWFYYKTFTNCFAGIANNNFNIYADLSNQKKIKKIIYDKSVDYISSFNDFVYFLDGEYLYEYIPKSGSKKIARNFEWNFNKENTIFIYNE